MIQSWDEMSFWTSGEWDVIQENLNELEAQEVTCNPVREKLFESLDLVPYAKVRVAFIGQDPYPNPDLATGVAFSIPAHIQKYPGSLANIFTEYCTDLHYPYPSSGDLGFWCEQGALLWNASPTCVAGQPCSHSHWPEWQMLTQEIVENLQQKGVVFVLLGARARKYAQYITDTKKNRVIELSHPSPRASIRSKQPFRGSRLFSRVNAGLCELKLKPINWRLV